MARMKEKAQNTHTANLSTEIDHLWVYDYMYKHFAQSCIAQKQITPTFDFWVKFG